MSHRYVTSGPVQAPGDEPEYLTRDDRGDPQTITIHEAERTPIDTGLLNASGAKLYRVEDCQRIGFPLRG